MLGLDELYVVTGDSELVRNEDYRMDELLSKRWIFREEGSGDPGSLFISYRKV